MRVEEKGSFFEGVQLLHDTVCFERAVFVVKVLCFKGCADPRIPPTPTPPGAHATKKRHIPKEKDRPPASTRKVWSSGGRRRPKRPASASDCARRYQQGGRAVRFCGWLGGAVLGVVGRCGCQGWLGGAVARGGLGGGCADVAGVGRVGAVCRGFGGLGFKKTPASFAGLPFLS